MAQIMSQAPIIQPMQVVNPQKISEQPAMSTSNPIEYTVLKQNALLERQNSEITSLKAEVMLLNSKLTK